MIDRKSSAFRALREIVMRGDPRCHDRVITIRGHTQFGELFQECRDRSWCVGQQHNRSEFAAKPGKRFHGFLMHAGTIVNDAPDVADQSIMPVRDLAQTARNRDLFCHDLAVACARGRGQWLRVQPALRNGMIGAEGSVCSSARNVSSRTGRGSPNR